MSPINKLAIAATPSTVLVGAANAQYRPPSAARLSSRPRFIIQRQYQLPPRAKISPARLPVDPGVLLVLVARLGELLLSGILTTQWEAPPGKWWQRQRRRRPWLGKRRHYEAFSRPTARQLEGRLYPETRERLPALRPLPGRRGGELRGLALVPL